MKLFFAVLVIYVLTITLFGVDGRGGTMKGLRASIGDHFRARRHVPGEAPSAGTFANEKPPPPPPQFRSRRNVMNLSANTDDGPPHQVASEAPHMRQRRQMPPPPEGLPPPPQGMPPPPS